MAVDGRAAGEQASLEVVRDRTKAWWTAALAGQLEQSHPVYGTEIAASIDDDVLVIKGVVPSEEDRHDLEQEVQQFKGKGVGDVRVELEVKPESTDQRGLLIQRLIGVFESDDQAGFASGYLETHARVNPGSVELIASGDTDRLHRFVPESYWEDVQRALDAGRSVLVVTVDETEAFKARELLDEDTRSLETIVLPPEPGDGRPKVELSKATRAAAAGADSGR